MDRFGENLYSIYGSTEIAWASIADPADLRAAPGTAGRLPHATVVRILDEAGAELPTGEAGRIFVGNVLQIEGYTGGGGKEIVDGLMSSGDVGRFVVRLRGQRRVAAGHGGGAAGQRPGGQKRCEEGRGADGTGSRHESI